MSVRRVPIDSATEHQPLVLEGNAQDRLPSNRVYVDPDSGESLDGSRGHSLAHLRGGEIEIPKTTWY